MALQKQNSGDDHINNSDYLESTLEKTVSKKRAFKRERRPVPPDMLERLQRLREEIMKDRNGELFEDSTEMIRQMREERAEYLASLHTLKGEE